MPKLQIIWRGDSYCLLANMRDKTLGIVDQSSKKVLSVLELEGLVVRDGALMEHAMELSPVPSPPRVVPE